MNTFENNMRYPMPRKLRKNPRIALVVFITSVVVVTTVLVNLVLFHRGCEPKSPANSFTGPVEPLRHQTVSSPLENAAGAAPIQNDPVVRLVSSDASSIDTSAEFIVDRANGRIIFPKPISRSVLGRLVEHMKLKSGFEIGVRQGVFSKEMLRQWPSCQSYFLVDLWSNPDQYLGGKNLQSTQEQNMRDAFENTSPWKKKISHCRNFSTVCADEVRDNQFDFGYVDARHDFKSVYEDLEAWYPKIRTGGVIAGHDYMSGFETKLSGGIDWDYNQDKTKDHARQAVKGAVNMFFAVRGQYLEPCSPIPSFSSWVVYKAEPGRNKPNDLLHFIDFKCFVEANCDFISERFAHTVRAWETMNPRFLVLVWTAETLGWFMKEDVMKYKTSYKDDPKAYKDWLKLKVIHKFGGTYIHESITPLQGLRGYVEHVKVGAAGPVAFCEHGVGSGDGEFTKNCKKVSRLLLSGNKDDRKILELANIHEREFSGGSRDASASIELTERILNPSEFHVFKSPSQFPCNSFSLSSGCVAQLNY